MKTAHEYINSLPGVIFLETRSLKVTIGNEVYENACRYRRHFEGNPTAPNPAPYVQEMVYVVGFLPKCEDRKVCYTVEGEEFEWYNIGGAYGITKADRRKPIEPSEFNPFGNFFQLQAWDTVNIREPYKGQKIDHYEPKPYLRVKAKFEVILPQFYECGICGHLHPANWNGDCREDANRFTTSQIEDKYGNEGTGWEEVPMPE